MILHRVVFHDKSTNEHYNNWHTTNESAEMESIKLIKDGITDKTFIDTKELVEPRRGEGKNERSGHVTTHTAVKFMNEHALVNIDMADNDEIDWHESQLENDSFGG